MIEFCLGLILGIITGAGIMNFIKVGNDDD